MKNIFKTLLFLPIFVFLLGCSKPVEPNKQLNIYTWDAFIPDEIIKDFEAQTGIKVNISFYDNNDTMLAKLITGVTDYDIVSPSTDYVQFMIKAGLIEKLDKSKLQNVFSSLDFEGLNLMEYAKIYDEGLEYSIPYGFFATGITFNTKEISKEYPRDLSIFTDEKYKGRLTMLDDGREVLGMVLQHLGYESDTSDEAKLNEAKQLLYKFKHNIAKFDSTVFGKGLANTEFVASHGYPDVFYEIEEDDDRFEYFLPKGAMMYIDSMSITKNAKNADAAYKFLEFLYKPENQVKVFEEYRQVPVVKGVMELTDVKPIISSEEIIKNAKLPKGLDEKTKEKQDKIWNEIKLGK